MMNFFFQLSSVQRVVSVLLVMAVYVVLANQLFSPESFFYVSSYSVNLLGKYLCYALLALALDLVWRHFKPRPRRLLCPWWVCHGHVPDASNWG